MNNPNEPGVSKLELFQQSKLSLIDFNVEEAIKNLEICLNVGRENIRKKRTEKCTVLSVPLGKMQMIDNLMEDIENILDLTILLATKSDDGRFIECVAYSKPSIGDMIVVHLHSRLNGAMDSFHVNVYDSMEKMYSDLMERLEYQKGIHNNLMKAEDPLNVLKQFI